MAKPSQNLGSVDAARLITLREKLATTGLQESEKEEYKLLKEKNRRAI